MHPIVWISSYPKSGNTWFRIILSNILKKESDINNLEYTPISGDRVLIDNCCGFNTSFFEHDELDLLRPSVNNWFAENVEKITFRKCHDAYTFLDDGRQLLGEPKYHKAIYIIRNPLSVVASLANHLSVSIDKAVQYMNDNLTFYGKKDRYNVQLRQKMLSWSEHINSWINQEDVSVNIIRYEDLHSKPLEVLKEAFLFSGLDITESEIKEAIEKSKFDKVSQQEKENSFKENISKTGNFFRKGSTDSWKNELTKEQARIIVLNNSKLMIQFNYLTDEIMDFLDINKNLINK